MLNKARQILSRIEDYPFKLWQLLAWFIFVTFFRNLIESLSDADGRILGFKAFFLHYPLYYVAVFSTIIIIFYLLSRQDIYKIAKVVLVFSFFIFIAPLVDLFFPLSANMSYIKLESWDMVLKSYFSLALGGSYLQGASLGIKVELIFALFGALIYLILKRVSYLKAILGSLVVYVLIITSGLITTFYSFLYQKLGSEFEYDTSLIGLSWILISLILILFIFYLRDKSKFQLWLRKINWFRTSIVWIMIILGLSLYFYQRLNPADLSENLPLYIVKIIAAIFAGFLVWQIGRVMNDLADVKFDAASQNDNLLNHFAKNELINLLVIYLLFFAATSLLISYEFFTILAIYLLVGYFYCFKPIHLKRHFILASLALGFAYLLAFWAGYVLFFTKGDSLNLIPTRFSLLILLMMVLAISFKDVKDGASDHLQGMTTLVTAFGPRKAALIINFLIFIIALLPALFLKNLWLVIPGVLGYLIIFYTTSGFKDISNKITILLTFVAYLISAVLIINLTTPQYLIGKIDLAKNAGWHPEASQELWFLSSLVIDEDNNQYYFSQTYNPAAGSFFTLIKLEDNTQFKEFFPNDNNLAITKNQLNLNHPLAFYNDANQIKAKDNFSYTIQSSFEKGLLRFNLANQKPPSILTLAPAGEISLKNRNKVKYFAFPNLETSGQIVFEKDKLVAVSGETWLEHLWGDFKVDYRRWNIFNLNLDNEARILISIFDYGDSLLVYGSLIEKGKQTQFQQLEIIPIAEWENPETKNKWLTELEIKNSDLNFNFNLKAIFPEQEIIDQNIWEGLMIINGEMNGKSTTGWANFREVRY
jgi:4-hydroxybenzoate polyprenyltransferase